MVSQSASETLANCSATKTCSPGYCLWQCQEWLESPHAYPDASSQWRASKHQHPGNGMDAPAGAPIFWTGGSHGYGHIAIADGTGKCWSTDQQSSGKVALVPISEIKSDWGLPIAGWTEDIADVLIPYLANGGNPNPNGVKVGDTAIVTANGSLNGRSTPGGDVVTSRPYGDTFAVTALSSDGKWASDGKGVATASRAALSVTGSNSPLVPVYGNAYLNGWDVSSNNPDSWAPADNEDFGWVKATEGKSYVNPDYATQLKKARDADQVTGHYHWLNNGDVTAQVNWFKSKADVRPGETIAVDWEDSSNPSTAQKDQAIKALQEAYPNNRVGLYCNRDWWLNHDTSGFYGDFLWIANYGPSIEEGPGIQAPWMFWQYTSSPYDKNYGAFADVSVLAEWAVKGKEPPDPGEAGNWFSTDYLFPQIKPDPTNPNGLKKGDLVEVTADTLTARILPGGPQSTDPPSRAKGYQFDITGDLKQGWVTGGTNWYSSDYLKKVTTPPPAKPGWKLKIALPMTNVPGSVSYLQGFCHVDPVTTDDGHKYAERWVVAQDYNNEGDLRFLLFDENGKYLDWMQVNDAGHGQTIYAYRSAAGNFYVWCGEDPAYRYKWQSGKKVSRSSGTKMDYKGARPMAGYNDRVAFRDATDSKETFSIFDRTDFTDGTNKTKPKKTVTVSKRTTYGQQGWGCNESRIFRLMGSTDENCSSGGKMHILDVMDWTGKLLLDQFDVTNMHRSGSTECEPEGIAFSTNGSVAYAGKREGPASASKRAYVVWELTGMP